MRKCPKILIILLKRFDNHNSKIDHFIAFPEQLILTGLGVLSEQSPAMDNVYEFSGVGSRHRLTIINSHHTVICRRPNGEFVEFNDKNCTVINKDDALKTQAYLLIYKNNNQQIVNNNSSLISETSSVHELSEINLKKIKSVDFISRSGCNIFSKSFNETNISENEQIRRAGKMETLSTSDFIELDFGESTTINYKKYLLIPFLVKHPIKRTVLKFKHNNLQI